MGEGLLPLKYNPNIVMRDVTFGYGIGIQIPYTDDGKGAYAYTRTGVVCSCCAKDGRDRAPTQPTNHTNQPQLNTLLKTPQKTGNIQVPRPGEFSWGGGMSTNFWVSPTDDTVIVTMVQIMPFTEGAWVDWTDGCCLGVLVGVWCVCVEGWGHRSLPYPHTRGHTPRSPHTNPETKSNQHHKPKTTDLKFAVRDWAYRSIDAFAHKATQGGIAISPLATDEKVRLG